MSPALGLQPGQLEKVLLEKALPVQELLAVRLELQLGPEELEQLGQLQELPRQALQERQLRQNRNL